MVAGLARWRGASTFGVQPAAGPANKPFSGFWWTGDLSLIRSLPNLRQGGVALSRHAVGTIPGGRL